jgi:hypothetical protein
MAFKSKALVVSGTTNVLLFAATQETVVNALVVYSQSGASTSFTIAMKLAGMSAPFDVTTSTVTGSPFVFPKVINLQSGESIYLRLNGGSVAVSGLVSYFVDTSADNYPLVGAGAWSILTTYTKNVIVSQDNNSYLSMAVGNVGNSPATDTGTWWTPLATNSSFDIAISSELTSDTSGVLNTTTRNLGLGSTLTNKTLTGAKFTGNAFKDVTGTYTYTLPTLTTNDTVVTLTGTQTLTNKTLTSPVLTTPTFSGALTLGGLTTLSGGYLETVNIVAGNQTNYTMLFGDTDATIQKITTSTTTSALITITLPSSANTCTGKSATLICVMGGATQSIAFSTGKVSTTITPSTTAGAIDIYGFVSDGVNWYITQCDKGF